MNFLGANSQETVIFGYSPNNEIRFSSICTDANSNLLWNGNLLYQITPSDGKPQYSNGVYLCYFFGTDWVVDLIATQEEVRVTSSAAYPWQAGIGSRSCPNGDCGDYGVGAITLDGRTLYYIGDTSYTDGQYIVYYDSINQQWSYEEISTMGISYIPSTLPYPWLAGLGQKDCAADFYNAVIVSGAGEESSNGTYLLSTSQNYRPAYYNGGSYIFFNSVWYLYDETAYGGLNTYASTNSNLFPWQGTWVVEDAPEPAPTLTPINI